MSWWRRLSTGWRVNVGLYCLATVSLVALVGQLATGGGNARRVQVASGGRSSTTTSSPATTTVETTTTLEPATTLAPPPTPGGATTTRPPATAASGPPALVVTTGPPTTLNCRNSSDPRCGQFRFDPPPAPNQPLTVAVTTSATAVQTGTEVTFDLTVTDPDHAMSLSCSVVDFGDGTVIPAPCAPPGCPQAFGPWDPPPARAGNQQITYRHTYQSPGTYTARFTFHTDKDTCPLLDPYGSAGAGESAPVTVTTTTGT